MIPLAKAIAHDEETLGLLRQAQAHLAGTCGCTGMAEAVTEHEAACTAAFVLGCHAAQERVLVALGHSARELKDWLDRRRLELRIEALEVALAERGGAA